MADPTSIIFIAANIYDATSTTESSPPAFPTPGGDRVWYIAPDCYDDPALRVYKPGQKRVQYPNYVEQWRGWPSIQYTLPYVNSEQFVLIMAQFELARNLDGWVWFSQWDGQKRLFKLKLGIMEQPTVEKFTNTLYKNVKLGFSGIRPTEYSI
jgi:hypothetical protein